MAHTQAERDTLAAAIASGALVVQVDGRRVEYRSLTEMRETLALIDSDLAAQASTPLTRLLRLGGGKGVSL